MRALGKWVIVWVWPLLLAVGMVLADDEVDAPWVARLSLVDGDVTFMRVGAEDWVSARLNTPLAAGDLLQTDAEGAVELQFGDSIFVRMAGATRLELLGQQGENLRLRVDRGRVAVDATRWEPGLAMELSSPEGVFLIQRAGYYRIEVAGDTRFIVRDGGHATLLAAQTEATTSLYAEEAIIIDRVAGGAAHLTAAPAIDVWDRWNRTRTDELTAAASARHLPPGVAGARELDQYGTWRDESDYGAVWVPRDVPPGWAPYSTGRWIADPYYEWSWVDDAPWGWAPFHYGRWVHLDGVWAWAPGPRPSAVRRATYYPALVAFYGVSPGITLRIGWGAPSLSWVALSWGEPLLPWWRPHPAFGQPWWGGWYGPRVVKQVVIRQTTVVDARHSRHHNSRVPNAVVHLPLDRFGRRDARPARVATVYAYTLAPVRGSVPVSRQPPTRPGASHDRRPETARTIAAPVTWGATAVREDRPAPTPQRREPERAHRSAPTHTSAPSVEGTRRPLSAEAPVPRPPRGQSSAAPERPRFLEQGGTGGGGAAVRSGQESRDRGGAGGLPPAVRSAPAPRDNAEWSPHETRRHAAEVRPGSAAASTGPRASDMRDRRSPGAVAPTGDARPARPLATEAGARAGRMGRDDVTGRGQRSTP